MKLLFCKACGDVQKLQYETRTCRCRESSGYYLPDGDNCVIAGSSAVVIAMGNGSLVQAVQRQPETGDGPEIKAWVFPKDYHKIKRAE